MSDNEDSFSPIEARLRRRRQRLGKLPYERVMLLRVLTHLHKRMQETLQDVLAANGLTLATYEVAMVLYDAPDESMIVSDLSLASGEKPANLTRICDALVAAGWVERQPDAQDRRAVRVRLSAAGHAHIEAAQPAVWAMIDELFGPLDTQEAIAMQSHARRLIARSDLLRGKRK